MDRLSHDSNVHEIEHILFTKYRRLMSHYVTIKRNSDLIMFESQQTRFLN